MTLRTQALVSRLAAYRRRTGGRSWSGSRRCAADTQVYVAGRASGPIDGGAPWVGPAPRPPRPWGPLGSGGASSADMATEERPLIKPG